MLSAAGSVCYPLLLESLCLVSKREGAKETIYASIGRAATKIRNGIVGGSLREGSGLVVLPVILLEAQQSLKYAHSWVQKNSAISHFGGETIF